MPKKGIGRAGPLREKYMEDAEARAFLKRHPEFGGVELESTHDLPQHDAEEGRERERSLKSERDLVIQEALLYYDEDLKEAGMLRDYYAGAKLRDIAHKYKMAPSGAKEAVRRARIKVYMWAKLRPWEQARLSPASVATRTIKFVWRGVERPVFLVNSHWVAEDWRLLPDDVQDILTNNEWDFVDLASADEG